MSDALGKLFEANNAAITARELAVAAEQERIQAEKTQEELAAFEMNITQALGPNVFAVLIRPLFYQKNAGKCTLNFTARNVRFDLTQREDTTVELELPQFIDAVISPPQFKIDSPTAREQFLSGLESIFRYL